MQLWLYSSGGYLNESMDLAMMERFRSDHPRLCFIPSSFDETDAYFEEFVERFGRFGFDDFYCFHLDQKFTQAQLKKAMTSDLIYLSGGNTYYFLASCRRSGIYPYLEQFLSMGGILAGNSAGAILMTPNIATAGYPEDDRDEDIIGTDDLTSFGFVDFEFYPHYDHSDYYRRVLKAASMETAHVLYGVPDGSGICLNGPALCFFGEVFGFFNGECFRVSD